MNATKTMLKGLVLTALMQAIQAEGRKPNEAEIKAVNDFNQELDTALDGGLLDRSVTEVFPELLAALETLEEVL
jgi:hypothetical protein